MGDQSWADYIKESCIGPQCWAAGVLYSETGELFEVAADDDNGWAHLYADEHQQEIDGEMKTINETAVLLELLETGKSSSGIWLAEKKYHVMRTDMMPFKDDEEYQVTLFAKGKIGGVLAKGPTYSVIGLYDEEKEQTKNGCVGVVLEFCHVIRAM